MNRILRPFRQHPSRSIALAAISTVAISAIAISTLTLRRTADPIPQPQPSLKPHQKAIQAELNFYQTKAQQNPNSSFATAALASAYWKFGKATGDESWYLLAEQTAQKAIALSPVAPTEAPLVLAKVAQAKHNFSQTETIAKSILKSQPNSDEAKAILITNYLATGRLKEAENLVKPLVDRLPNLSNFTLQGLVEEAQGKASAAQTWQFGLQVEERGEESTSAQARVFLGRHFYHRGQYDRAQKHYTEALQFVPNYPLALAHLAALETQRGNYSQADRHYQQIAEDHRGLAYPLDHIVLRGQARLKQRQNQSADALFQEAEKLLRENVDFGHRRDLAQLLLDRAQNQDVKEAMTLMEQEVKVRQDATTMAVWARSLLANDRRSEARQAMQQALKSGVQQAGFFYQAGAIEQAMGNEKAAEAYRSKAKQLDPTGNGKLGLDVL